MNSAPTLAPDAAMVLGIASTAMPFARTSEDEVERWLRVLRLHGQVGIALQRIGVSEGAFPVTGESPTHEHADAIAAGEPDAVARVVERAVRIANERGASALATTDLLVGVMDVYGEDFDHVLEAHGTDRDEVLERLGISSDA